jgi:hypothetical protein
MNAADARLTENQPLSKTATRLEAQLSGSEGVNTLQNKTGTEDCESYRARLRGKQKRF